MLLGLHGLRPGGREAREQEESSWRPPRAVSLDRHLSNVKNSLNTQLLLPERRRPDVQERSLGTGGGW